MIAAGLFITPERQKQVRFSRPTFRATIALLVPISAHPSRFQMVESIGNSSRQGPGLELSVPIATALEEM